MRVGGNWRSGPADCGDRRRRGGDRAGVRRRRGDGFVARCPPRTRSAAMAANELLRTPEGRHREGEAASRPRPPRGRSRPARRRVRRRAEERLRKTAGLAERLGKRVGDLHGRGTAALGDRRLPLAAHAGGRRCRRRSRGSQRSGASGGGWVAQGSFIVSRHQPPLRPPPRRACTGPDFGKTIRRMYAAKLARLALDRAPSAAAVRWRRSSARPRPRRCAGPAATTSSPPSAATTRSRATRAAHPLRRQGQGPPDRQRRPRPPRGRRRQGRLHGRRRAQPDEELPLGI